MSVSVFSRRVVACVLRSWLGGAALLALAPAGTAYGQTTYTVNSVADLVDANLLDPACDAGGGQCTLRAAVQQANAMPGDDTIVFDPALNGVPITLTIPPVDGCPPLGCFNEADDSAGDLDILESLSVIGNGPANTIVQAGTSLATAVDGVFEIVSPVCYHCITTQFSGLTLRNGRGPAGGPGALWVNGGALVTTITDSVVSDNENSGIFVNYAGQLFLNRVTLARNRGPRGGGLVSFGSTSSIDIVNSAFVDNTADDAVGGGKGGGLFIDAAIGAENTPTIVNTTFSGNLAAAGCAIFNADGLLLLHDVTVANNCVPGSGRAALVAAADGEGVGTTSLGNSVVASPPGVVNCQTIASPYDTGSFISEGYNIVSDATCGLAAAGDVQNTDPLLGPLAGNGGPTQTHLLLPGSPAIDTGTPLLCPATDQRGLARPVDGDGDGVAQCDRGAVEVAASAPPATTGTVRGAAWDDPNFDGIRVVGEPPLPGLPVCIFPSAPTLCTTTLPDGSYQFSGLAAGTYQVYEKLPVSRVNSTPRSRTVNVAVGGVVTSVDFGSRVPPPPPPGWNAPVVGQQVFKGATFFVRITPPCPAGAVTATVFYSGLTVSQAMTNLGGNSWETEFLTPGGPGLLPIKIEADCSPLAFNGYIQFIDPSGVIRDGCTGQPLAGATVTLFKNDPFGSFTYVLPDPTEHIPPVNPQVTLTDGIYAWDVVPGRWRVQAAKAGYDTVTTDPFDVPPPKLNLDITLTPAAGCNVAPVAKDDAYTAAAATLTVAAPGVLANDTDADGHALTAVLVTSAAHGHVTLGANGSFTYVANAGFSGTDTFTYKASDGRAESNVATVRIAVKKVNRPPVAGSDTYRTTKNRAFFMAAPGVLANDADPEGSALTAALVRCPDHGFVLLFPNGSLVYLPAPGFVGTDTFTYKASDGALASNTATVTITVAKR